MDAAAKKQQQQIEVMRISAQAAQANKAAESRAEQANKKELMSFLKNAADLNAKKELEDARFKADVAMERMGIAHEHGLKEKDVLLDIVRAEHAAKRGKPKKGE